MRVAEGDEQGAQSIQHARSSKGTSKVIRKPDQEAHWIAQERETFSAFRRTSQESWIFREKKITQAPNMAAVEIIVGEFNNALGWEDMTSIINL